VASLDVVTFVKVFSLLFSSLNSGSSRGNPRSGAHRSDNAGARRRYPPLRASFLEQMSAKVLLLQGTLDLGLSDRLMATRGAVLPI
jgi:hypothetical protein